MERKQKLEAQIRKQVACEERAHNVVIRLLEDTITPDYLIDAGQLITPSHYADVEEERAIAKQCGYPICNNSLGNTPKQKYHISTKSNKVYDITERKNFCSNKCFKASKYFKKQISTSPVWSREEGPRVDFKLLDLDKTSGAVGDEIFLTSPRSKLRKESEELKRFEQLGLQHPQSESQSATEQGDSLTIDGKVLESDLVDGIAKLNFKTESVKSDKGEVTLNRNAPEKRKTSPKISEDTSTLAGQDGCNTNLDKCDITRIPQEYSENETGNLKGKNVINSLGPQDNATNKPFHGETKTDYLIRLLDKKKKLLGKMADIQPSVQAPEPKPIPGERKVTEKVTDRKTCQTPISSEASINITDEQSCCLSTKQTPLISDITDDKLKSATNVSKLLQSQPAHPTELSPFSAVCKTVKEWITKDTLVYLGKGHSQGAGAKTDNSDFEKKYLELCQKVESHEEDFDNLLEGDVELQNTKPSTTKPLPDYNKLKKETKEFEIKVKEYFRGSLAYSGTDFKKGMEDENAEKQRDVILPTVDSHDQMLIRRKIVLDKVDKVIPDLLTLMKLSVQDVSGEIRELIHTFFLTSQNILYKPAEWMLVGIILMKLLSLKVKKVDDAFKELPAVNYFMIVLEGIGLSINQLDVITEYLLQSSSDL